MFGKASDAISHERQFETFINEITKVSPKIVGEWEAGLK
jgi:hypothetical protein